MPLPGTRIIPTNWQARHRPLIAATFRTELRVIRLADQRGTRNETTGRTSFAVPYIVYEGLARVQSRTGTGRNGGPVPVGDRMVTLGAYLVALPTDTQPGRIGDIVEIVTCPDAPALNGLSLKILDTPAADIAWQRSYGCDLHQPTARG